MNSERFGSGDGEHKIMNTKQDNSEPLPALEKITVRVTGICQDCGQAMVYNVPRLGPTGGFVHERTRNFGCEANKTLVDSHAD